MSPPARECTNCGMPFAPRTYRGRCCSPTCARERRHAAQQMSHARNNAEREDELLQVITSRRYGVTAQMLAGALSRYEGADLQSGAGGGRNLYRVLRRLRDAGLIVAVRADGVVVYTLPGREHLAESRAA